MQHEVVLAKPDDAMRLSELMVRLESQTSFMMYEAEEIPNVDMLKKRISVGSLSIQEVFLLAQDTYNLVGYTLVCCGSLSRNRGVGTLSIGVLQEVQSRGVGSALLCEAITWAKSQKLYRLQLQVQTCNKRALSLYLKFGFKIEGILHRCAFIKGKYVDKYQMALLL